MRLSSARPFRRVRALRRLARVVEIFGNFPFSSQAWKKKVQSMYSTSAARSTRPARAGRRTAVFTSDAGPKSSTGRARGLRRRESRGRAAAPA